MGKKIIRKDAKGITLIALVVTIIVLLLLAGISMLALTGNNGILNKSRKSAADTERENLREEIQVGVMGNYGENGFDVEKFQEEIEKEYGVKVKDEDKWEDGFRVDIEGKYGDYTVLVEKDETGKPRVGVEEKGEDGKLSTPPTLAGSDTKIEFDPSDWTNKGVKVTITLDKKIDKGTSVLQYSIDEGESWSTYRRAFEVVENNTVIIARLYNGETEGGTTTATIRRIDKLPPKILNVEEVGHTTSTVTLNVVAKEEEATATDGESGINRYYFMVDNSGKWEPKEGSEREQYTIGNLKQNKEHEIKVKVTDVAGNETIREEGIKVTTKSLQDLGEATSNTVIDFSPDDWTAEGVQVTITTNAEISGETKLQYSINEGKDWTDYNDTPFKVTENGTVIIARLYDGTNESGYATATVKLIDKVNPYDTKIEVIGEKKTSKIEVRVSAKDTLSGIKRYKFYYSINGGASYIEAGTKEVAQSKESTTTYEYENLTDETNYKLKVEAYDYVNNKNEGEITTEGSTKAMPNVNNNNLKISFTPTTWTNEVTVTITPAGLDIEDNEIQYMIEGGEWTPYNSSFTVSKKNTAVVARLWDGTNESSTSTGTIILIDRVDPSTVSISENTKDSSSITVNVTAVDGSATTESGKSGIKKLKYYYSTNNGSSYTYKDEVTLTTSNTGTYSSTYKYTGLTAGTTYRLKVEAYDEAGNMKAAETASGGIQLGTPPTISTVTPSRAYSSSKHSITLTVKATDPEGGTLDYTVQYGTSEGSYNYTATGSGTAGSNTTIKLDNLSEYTRYYYKVTATDSTGITSTTGFTGNYKTYCLGTYCSGGGTSSYACTASGCVNGKKTGSEANGATCTASGCVNGTITTTVTNGATCTASGCVNGTITTTSNCTTCGGDGIISTACTGTMKGTVTYHSSGGSDKIRCYFNSSHNLDTSYYEANWKCPTCGYVEKGNSVSPKRRVCGSSRGCNSKWKKKTKACDQTVDTTCTANGCVNGKITTTSKCTTCGGDGKVTRYYTYDCTTCGGDGRVSYTYNCSAHNYYNSHYWCSIHGNNAGQYHGEV